MMNKRFIAYFLVTVLALTLLIGCSSEEKKEDISTEEEYVPVEIETSSVRTISDEVSFSGKVYPDKDIMVMPKIPGKVSSVKVQVGSEVKKGDVLFTMDSSDIQKQVDQAGVALEGALNGYEMTKERIDNAKIALERTKQLYAEGAVSQAQLEQAQLAASDKSLEASKAQLNQTQVAYSQAKDALNNSTITSPLNGVVASINIEAGEMASNAQPAMTIVAIDKLYVQINVTESSINKLKEGQDVRIIIPSVSDTDITGKIDSISPTPDLRTQLYPVKIFIENKENLVKTGMFAKVSLNINSRENVVTVKSEAIIDKNGQSIVYIVEDDKAVEKIVEIGLDTGEYVEITKGLDKDQKVIIKGQSYLENETKVKVVRGDK